MTKADTSAPGAKDQFGARVRNYYDRGSHLVFEALYEQINRHALAPFFSIYLQDKGQTLDVGAGSGHLARELNLKDAVFVELSGRQLRRFKGSGFPGRFVQADLLNLAFADKRFDQVICSNVLHYTGLNGLVELIRVTKPGGRLLLAFLEASLFTRAFTRLAVSWGLFPTLMEKAPLLRLTDLAALNLTIADQACVVCTPPWIQACRHLPPMGLVALACIKEQSA